MKKFLYGIFALMTICSFAACGSDDDSTPQHETTAEQAFAGTYNGTWTVKWTDKATNEEQVVAEEGALVFEATDRAGVANITFLCPGRSLNAISVANIWYANDGFQFSQEFTTATYNSLGAPFSGRSDDGKFVTTAFTVNQKVGRSVTTFYYNFAGTRAE